MYVMRAGCITEQGFRWDLEHARGVWEDVVREIGAKLNIDNDAHCLCFIFCRNT